jgi:hypothetical protein
MMTTPEESSGHTAEVQEITEPFEHVRSTEGGSQDGIAPFTGGDQGTDRVAHGRHAPQPTGWLQGGGKRNDDQHV